MIVSFHPCIQADIQIILGERLPSAEEEFILKKADAIILPQGCSKKLYEICKRSGAILFPEYRYRFEYEGKIGQIRLFKEFGLPHPCSIPIEGIEEISKKWDYLFSKTPFLLKKDMSHEGEGIYVIRRKEDLEKIKEVERREKILLQELIRCGGNVLRAVVIGDEIMTYWKRPAKEGQIITTISKNAIIDHSWMPELQEKGKRLVEELISKTGINLAALDMVFREENPLLLEINYFFGRRGLGRSDNYYLLLFQAIKKWLKKNEISHSSLKLSF